jgi:hypothetical protein
MTIIGFPSIQEEETVINDKYNITAKKEKTWLST